jgi:hypothetical protein
VKLLDWQISRVLKWTLTETLSAMMYIRTMQLHVSGITDQTIRYRFLWGFYVTGFKPWVHCQPCFRGTRAPGIFPTMANDRVDLPKRSDFFYLHGFAPGPKKLRGASNLHLAVQSKTGSVASCQSAFGPIFTIYDAEEILIQEPLSDAPHLGVEWTRCKNFRFGAQMYTAPVLGPDASRIPSLALRDDRARGPGA